MSVLSSKEKNDLDRAVQEACKRAEMGAENALLTLGVHDDRKPVHLTEEQAELRRRLRAERRRLGSFTELVRSVAYEQWHRMLFARFLAENQLLIHPEFKVPVTLAECEEIAREEGRDLWEIAADYASEMLPGIFRQENPLTRLRYAAEDAAALQAILMGIPEKTFRTRDALGWTYQFWQTDKKKELNASEKKVEGYDICAVTQLFTESYMVQFLLQNALGAWWIERYPENPLRNEWGYYKSEVQHDFSTWPESLAELKILDPCCGSGHFLVGAFHMLLAMRKELGEETESAIRGILEENLYGLELDPRCTPFAAFVIALEAWKAGFPVDAYMPVPNIACTGIPIRAEREEWLQLAGGDGLLEGVLGQYYDLFKNADSLGSLIRIEDPLTLVKRKALEEKFEQVLRREREAGDPVAETFGETGHAVFRAVGLLSERYDLIITNVPQRSNRKIGSYLSSFIKENYPLSKDNTATVFLERCLAFCRSGGKVSIVLPQNWLFLVSYRQFREQLLKSERWDLLARLGEKGFDSSAAAGAFTILLNISHTKSPMGHLLCGLDVSEECDAETKAQSLLDVEVVCVEQAVQLKNPDAIVHFENMHNVQLLGVIAICCQGTSTGDNPQFIRYFYETREIRLPWQPLESVPGKTALYSGKTSVINWDNVSDFPRSAIRGWNAFNQMGISIGQMRQLPATLYTGHRFPNTTPVIIPINKKHLPALWAFCSTPDFATELRKINQKLSVDNGYISKIPFDLPHWQKIATEEYPHGLPEPYSDDPTQWIFHGHPTGSVVWDEETKTLAHGPLRTDGSVLHTAIARLLGYRWPAELDPDMELADLQREWVRESETLLKFADEDGIIAIPSVRGEGRLVDRLRELLAAAYGPEWSPNREKKLLRAVGYTKRGGALKGGLEGFLRVTGQHPPSPILTECQSSTPLFLEITSYNR